MAYTAIEKMKYINEKRFGCDAGPMQPELYCGENKNDLKSAVLRFLHERCEGLLFNAEIEAQEQSGQLCGRSIGKAQIPYNMEMDINRLCLEKSLESFIDSGVADDAYAVYYCFLEMFMGRYGNSKKMVELLSEYEANGSSLLMKHRDHYSHSVYVFALGLAIYESNSTYRETYKKFYGLENTEDNCAANKFLEYWGMTSLFHDIGYPFELPFEQALSYFEVDNQERGKGCLYLAYHSVENFTALSEPAKVHFKTLFGKEFETVSDLIAGDITDKLGGEYGFDEAYMRDTLRRKPTNPQDFGYFMDHAFFSSVRLYKELADAIGAEELTKDHIDVLSAIMLHNSLYKFAIAFYKKKTKPTLRAELHPLAWLLMICDELQCWDRTAYGRNSRKELHPMAAEFDFSNNAISAMYYYDEAERDKIEAYEKQYAAWEKGGSLGKAPRLKAYSDMAAKEQDFTADIESIVNTAFCLLTVSCTTKEQDRHLKHSYLSNSNFLHLYDFAVAIHGRNMPPETTAAELEAKFQSLSLEYQLSVINRAKNFGRYLDAIDCFFTDRPVDYDILRGFTPEQTAVFAPMEHERWILEHINMGWQSGNEYETLPIDDDSAAARKALREQLRCHKLIPEGELTEESMLAHYRSLPEEEQDKDWKPFNSMLKLLKKFDGLRIYKLK